MSKKKDLIKKVKNNLKFRREEVILELKKLYRQRDECSDLDKISSEIDKRIKEISTIDQDLARKDKKSSNIQWADGNYKATPRGNGSRSAEIMDSTEYERFQNKKLSFDGGPTALWLKPGILVKAKNRTIPGIVVDIRNTYATVLFGGAEIDIRKLALRPADWED